MSKAAGFKIQSYCVHRRVVNVGEGLEAVGDESTGAPVLLIGEAVEHAVVVVDLPVQLAYAFRIAEGRVDPPVEGCERILIADRGILVLLESLRIQEEEQPVLHDGSAQAPAKIVALEWCIGPDRGAHGAVAEQVEPFTVPLI